MNLHIYPSDMTNESRIEKIVKTLIDHDVFEVVKVVGKGRRPASFKFSSGASVSVYGNLFESRNLILRTIDFLFWYLRIIREYWNSDVQCINAHSLSVLPLCVGFKMIKNCILVYDTHELETETNSTGGIRKKLGQIIERQLIGYCDATVVVSRAYAEWYVDKYESVAPVVIRNAPYYRNLARSEKFSLELGLDKSDFVFLYQGLLGEGRGLRDLIACFGALTETKAHFVVMGYGPLESFVRESAETFPNIHFKEAVRPNEVLAYTASADYGLCCIEPTSLSYEYALPNKLFEYCMAGTPVIAYDLPEIGALIRRERCGYLVSHSSPTDLKALIGRLSEDAEEYPEIANNARSVGRRFAWEVQSGELLQLYQQILISGE